MYQIISFRLCTSDDWYLIKNYTTSSREIIHQHSIGQPFTSRLTHGKTPLFDTIWLFVTVRHGKIHHAIKNGKPSISISHLYHGELLVITK